jgi:hypothetical protein
VGGVRSMNVMLDTNERVTIVCTREELDMLENGLGWFISECEGAAPDPDIDLAKQMMTDIANMRMM